MAAMNASTRLVVERNEMHDGFNHPVRIDVVAQGQGPRVVILPSLGRASDEFDEIAASLVEAGYRVLRPAPRGIGGSDGPREGVSLHDLAADVLAVIASDGAGPAVIAGHAFGNWIARVAAGDRPDLVRAVMILAAGPRKVAPLAIQGLEQCLDLSLPDSQRLPLVAGHVLCEGQRCVGLARWLVSRRGAAATRGQGGHAYRRLVGGGGRSLAGCVGGRRRLCAGRHRVAAGR